MTISYRIRCDACGDTGLYGRPHLTIGLRPSFPGALRDMHYCSLACLQKASGNLQPMLTAHGDTFRARGART